MSYRQEELCGNKMDATRINRKVVYVNVLVTDGGCCNSELFVYNRSGRVGKRGLSRM